MADTLTVTVPRGMKVNVTEVDNVSDKDPRIPVDRNVIITASKELKIAIKQSGAPVDQAKASVVLMCG
jgi:hypothetical protein